MFICYIQVDKYIHGILVERQASVKRELRVLYHLANARWNFTRRLILHYLGSLICIMVSLLFGEHYFFSLEILCRFQFFWISLFHLLKWALFHSVHGIYRDHLCILNSPANKKRKLHKGVMLQEMPRQRSNDKKN